MTSRRNFLAGLLSIAVAPAVPPIASASAGGFDEVRFPATFVWGEPPNFRRTVIVPLSRCLHFRKTEVADNAGLVRWPL